MSDTDPRFRRLRQGMRPFPYTKFSNDVAVQTEKSHMYDHRNQYFLKDLKLEGNKFVSPRDSFNKRKPKVLRETNKNDYASLFDADVNSHQTRNCKRRSSFQSYFMPTIIVNKAKKYKASKFSRNTKRVSFREIQNSPDGKTGIRKVQGETNQQIKIDLRLPTPEEREIPPRNMDSSLSRRPLSEIQGIHVPPPCSEVQARSRSNIYSISKNLTYSEIDDKCPKAQVQKEHRGNKRNMIRENSIYTYVSLMEKEKNDTKVSHPPVKEESFKYVEKLDPPEGGEHVVHQKRDMNLNHRQTVESFIGRRSVYKILQRIKPIDQRPSIQTGGSVGRAFSYNNRENGPKSGSLRKRTENYYVSSPISSRKVEKYEEKKATGAQKNNFGVYHNKTDKHANNSLVKPPIKYQVYNIPITHLPPTKSHCYNLSTTRINIRQDFVERPNGYPTPKSSSNLRYFYKQTHEISHRCECNSLSKQYGSSFCSNKRTSKSGIYTEPIQGKSLLKEAALTQIMRGTLEKRLKQHGIGCRYGPSARFHLPWFIQEDIASGEQIYMRVLPGLYVGNFRDSKDQDQLNKHNITHILAIHDNARKLPCNNDKEYLCIIASDSPGQNLTQFFPVCNDFIHTARLKGGNILIHCLAGMSRSVTVAVVYVMCVTSLSWRDALKAVQGARNVANPNVGFLKQLQEFEKDRLQEERRRLREKYPGETLVDEDEQMAKELVTSYYHYMSVGEMCDGNCHQGTVCPRGLCNQPRGSGIFRRNSRETSSSNRSSSPLRRHCSSPSDMYHSPKSSPESSRNPSPTPSPLPQRYSTGSTLTPPVSPYHFRKSPATSNGSPKLQETVYPDSPTRSRRSLGNCFGQSTPPGSPSRSFGYYTGPPTKSPSPSPSSGSLKNNNFSSSGSASPQARSFMQGKIIHCPSTPPSSPARSLRNRNNLSQMTPPPSPKGSLKEKNKDDLRRLHKNLNSSITSLNEKENSRKKSIKSNLKHNLMPASPHKKLTRLYQRETKSLDLSSPPQSPSKKKNSKEETCNEVSTSCNEVSTSNSPSKRRNGPDVAQQSSPSRFCQAVTKLLPQIAVLNNTSKFCKNIPKPFSKKESSLYVDERGRTIIKHNKNESSSISSVNVQTTDFNFDEDYDSSRVMFELCKNIQKLPKECEIYYEPSTQTVENDIKPERKVSVHTTIDISTYKNNSSTNIIINPIFSLENNYEAESLCHNQKAKDNKKTPSYSAFLEDDMIYVETTESNSPDFNLPRRSSAVSENQNLNTNDNKVVTVALQQEKSLRNLKKAVRIDDETLPENLGSLERDFSISKKIGSSFKGYTDFASKPTNVNEVLLPFEPSCTEGFEFSLSDKMENLKEKYTFQSGTFSSFKQQQQQQPRPSNSHPPPPIPPRKAGINSSTGRPNTPPPVPPRNMKPLVKSPPEIQITKVISS